MKSLRFLDRRVGFSLGALSILFGTMAPAIVPAFASADTQITSRSVAMSSAGGGDTNVQYAVTFTPNVSAGSHSLAVEFCSNSPLVGNTCTAPSGMVVNTSGLVVSGDSAAIDGTGADVGANYVDMTATLTSGANTITIGSSSHGVTNPSYDPTTSGTFYARIMIFDNGTDADAVDGTGGSTIEDTSSKVVDDGSVALAVENTLGVQAAVLESLTFCLFGDAGNLSGGGTANNASNNSAYLGGTSSTAAGTINSHNLYDLGHLDHTNVTNQGPGSNCSDSTAATYAGGTSSSNHYVSPNVQLGQYVANDVYALDTSNISYASDWAQLSTNASAGGIVYLKSSNSCAGGGLSTGDGSSCGIPGETGTLTAGTAGFGVKLGTPVNLDADSSLDGTITPESTYNNYALGANSNSTYGDSLFTTTGAPASNWDVPFGLGASISSNTAAGNYKDNLSLVAVGTF